MSAKITPRLGRWLTILFGILLLATLIAWGLQRQQDAFARRGIPETLAGPMIGAGTALGMNATLPADAAERDQMLAAIAATGVDTIKLTFYHSDAFDWTFAAAQLAAAADQGLAVVPLLDGDPGNGFAPPVSHLAFANWAAEFALRYGAAIDYYIIWDEPNLTSHWGNRPVNPDDYGALLATTSQAIREQDTTAYIVAAPLAPTVEQGPTNLAPQLFLQRLYEADVAAHFDIVAGKPYGFSSSPWDRTVDPTILNFSHIILLRETMLANGDDQKVIWAGNWGWNSLPSDWGGDASIWGGVAADTQAEWTIAGLERARTEWPWLGLMFLEHWRPAVDADSDPRWGYRVVDTPLQAALATWLSEQPPYAFPGYHIADPDSPGQSYEGGWRFTPELGADISKSGDAAEFIFYGTEVALRVRRADFRARFHVEVDGQPAPDLPRDETGATLVLTAPDPAEDYVTTVLVADDLEPGIHTVSIVADRGWDQWALRGYSVGHNNSPGRAMDWLFPAASVILALGLIWVIPAGHWPTFLRSQGSWFLRLTSVSQLLLTSLVAAITALTGWVTWGQQAAGLYRRLGDVAQLTLTATAAAVFYIAPSFYLYVAALLILFILVYLRPAWGLAIIAFSLPLYVLPKPLLGFRFSPVEIFILLTVVATIAHQITVRQCWPKTELGRAEQRDPQVRRLAAAPPPEPQVQRAHVGDHADDAHQRLGRPEARESFPADQPDAPGALGPETGTAPVVVSGDPGSGLTPRPLSLRRAAGERAERGLSRPAAPGRSP